MYDIIRDTSDDISCYNVKKTWDLGLVKWSICTYINTDF